MAVGGKEDNDLVNRFATKASTVAGSPEREAQFKQRYQQDTNPENSTLKPDDSYAYSLKEEEDELSELRRYLDMVEATSTPRINGFQQTTDDDGTVTSDYSVGPVSASTTQRPNTINTSSATVPLAHNVQLTVDKGIGFGGAGKDVTPGGNQVSTITARTAQNPEGTTSSFVGKPTAQDLEKAVPADWQSSGNEFSDPDISESELPKTPGLVMREWMALCR